MRVLVTGCAGFIGCHLSERLLREKHEVVGLDNLSSGSRPNVDYLAALPGFQFVEHNLSQPLPPLGRFDLICNLACPASPVDFERIPLEILAVCSAGMRNVLELACACNAPLLHTSTSEVYGDPKEHPQRETYWGHVNPIGKRSCYDEGKRFAEALAVAYRDSRGARPRIARIFNTYGPRMRHDDGRMLPNFILQALAGKPLTVHGDGSQTRSFCYVSDMVDGLLRLALSDVSEPVNLGNPVEITVLQAAEEVIRLTNSSSRISFVPRPPDDPCIRRPDITRAQQRLGWSPQIDRQDGFRRTIEWFRTGR
ncbi:MAG: SDR family oxidoreductase [Phycisphaerae bacterium]|nr:SDR family oxidoreductase [Phycisphaerae bacterium]